MAKRYLDDVLKNDIKTLHDISALLEKDGRYKAIPKLLNCIAEDIQNGLAVKKREEVGH